jgi:hypothetical protein
MPASDLASRALLRFGGAPSPPRRRLLTGPLVVGAAALIAEVTTHLIDFGVYDLRIRILDSSAEWSYSHLLATFALAAGALACARGAAWGDKRRLWRVASALFAFLCVDGATRLHEHVPAWPILYAPVLIALSGSLVAISSGTDQADVVFVGLALLFGSFAIHVFGPGVVHAFDWAPSGWAYQVKVALKEGSELAGWVILVPAVFRFASGPADRRFDGLRGVSTAQRRRK